MVSWWFRYLFLVRNGFLRAAHHLSQSHPRWMITRVGSLVLVLCFVVWWIPSQDPLYPDLYFELPTLDSTSRKSTRFPPASSLCDPSSDVGRSALFGTKEWMNSPCLDIPIKVLSIRSDRRQYMEQMLSYVGFLNVSFPPPLHRSEMNIDHLLKEKRISPNFMREGKWTLGQIANTVDHIRFLESHDEHAPFVGIFEDDIVPAVSLSDVVPFIKRTLAALPQSADALYLEMCYERCKDTLPVGDVPYLRRSRHPACAASIIFTKKGRRRVIAAGRPPRHPEVDGTYGRMVRDLQLEAYHAFPLIFAQDAFWGSNMDVADRDLSHAGRIHVARNPICKRTEFDMMLLSIRGAAWTGILVAISLICVWMCLRFFTFFRRILSRWQSTPSHPGKKS